MVVEVSSVVDGFCDLEAAAAAAAAALLLVFAGIFFWFGVETFSSSVTVVDRQRGLQRQRLCVLGQLYVA